MTVTVRHIPGETNRFRAILKPYFTTAKCPDGTFYAAVWSSRGILICMSEDLPSRIAARTWGRSRLKEVTR